VYRGRITPVAPAAAAALVAAAYAVGTFPTAVLVARSKGHDVTAEGSKNPGATNVYRIAGRKAAAKVFLGDAAKGALAAAVGLVLSSNGHRSVLALAMGAAAVVGHCLPATRRFNGGKGVATAAGFAAVVEPFVGLGAAVVWAVTAKATKRASLASLIVALAAPTAILVWRGPHLEAAVLGAVSLFVVTRHWRNIQRLIRGEESRLNRVERSA
jgi:acyl phosphate:glycerol-3-phosphate acyltransferase